MSELTPRPSRIYIGTDPGPIPGIVALTVWETGKLDTAVIQCSHGVASTIVNGLLDAAHLPVTLATERFVARGRASAVQSITRDLVGQLQEIAHSHGARFVQRSASEVKPWATDCRLQAAVLSGDSNLFLHTAGMRHARDAARHALFAAVKDGGLPDPLSKNWSNR